MDPVTASNLFFLGSLIFVGLNVIILYFIRKRVNKLSREVNRRN